MRWKRPASGVIALRHRSSLPVGSRLFLRGAADSASQKKYSDTLCLPKTKFKARPSPADLARYLKQTGSELYGWQRRNVQGSQIVFHDGPPYANGALHLGHALNKVLKDIISRFHLMMGHKVHYVPGWDCHGLPNELAAMEKARKKMGNTKLQQLSIADRRKLAQQHALAMSEKQKDGFEGFAVMADWHGQYDEMGMGVYRTFTPDYVLRQLKVYKAMVDQGLISRQKRPVYWSVESGTALAESELQYGDQKDQTVVFRYSLTKPSGELQAVLKQNGIYEPISVAIWTTTPWTLVANRAIAVNPELNYVISRHPQHGLVVTSASRRSELGADAVPLDIEFPGSLLVGSSYSCPLRGNTETFPILPADYVTDTSGTGLVHSAPGHGKEDYLLCKEHGIEPFSPIDNLGRYTSDLPCALEHLEGLDARQEGQIELIEALERSGQLVGTALITHSVPFDWRSKAPVMVRSTPQFFADVESIKDDAIKSIGSVNFHPETGRTRLMAFTLSRSEWCISRQRIWGVPIPVLYHKETGDALMSSDIVEHIITRIGEHGDEGLVEWFSPEEDNVARWLPSDYQQDAHLYVKGTETMDVWFDSGTSWTMLQEDSTISVKQTEPLASFYLEGSDQHRGWFQSSLLTRIAASSPESRAAPFQNVITHGFVLDEKGQKMSKSLGNVVTPEELIKGSGNVDSLGIDGMRLWIAQSDYTSDVAISPVIIKQVGALVKKLRVTYKFLLGNLKDFGETEVRYEDLKPIDKKTLASLYELSKGCIQDYESFAFNRVVKRIQNHLSVDLSALYFDVVKDRLYADKPGGLSRTAAQYVLLQILRLYTTALAPITPLLSQEVWESSPELVHLADSPFKNGWVEVPEEWNNSRIVEDFKVLTMVRGLVNATMEQGRSEKTIRSSLSAQVYIQADPSSSVGHILKQYAGDLEELFISSDVHLSAPPSDAEWRYSLTSEESQLTITVVPASRHKCPRCWKFGSAEEDTLCGRCEEVVA